MPAQRQAQFQRPQLWDREAAQSSMDMAWQIFGDLIWLVFAPFVDSKRDIKGLTVPLSLDQVCRGWPVALRELGLCGREDPI